MTPAAIKAWRLQRGCSQAEAGALVGVSRRTFAAWELGERAPELLHRLAMGAVALGLDDYAGPAIDRLEADDPRRRA